MGKSDESSNVENGTRKWAHIIIIVDTRTKTAISSSSRGKYGAHITRAQVIRMTSVITREVVAATLPLTVKVQKMRRSLRTVT